MSISLTKELNSIFLNRQLTQRDKNRAQILQEFKFLLATYSTVSAFDINEEDKISDHIDVDLAILAPMEVCFENDDTNLIEDIESSFGIKFKMKPIEILTVKEVVDHIANQLNKTNRQNKAA